ncbi:MAG: hypothetical protein VKP57_02450 [Candidatus Sericytochromatia bacterium]|nr:hypothetical protein [Candidatus Sericytochromatia bacterium]
MTTHQLTFRLRLEPGGDDRAPGGAITMALCGHWDHEGPCRWPHLTETRGTDDDLEVNVRLTCPDSERGTVLARIEAALATGSLLGPDGRTTRWSVLGPDTRPQP